MNLIQSFETCTFKKYSDFKGRSTKSEYWWFWFIYMLGIFGTSIMSFILGDIGMKFTGYFLMILFLATLLTLTCPFIAVSIRRLHDSGLSGWNFLWRFIPCVGFIITVILMLRNSKKPEELPDLKCKVIE